MKTIFYLAGKPEPLAELDLDIIGVDEVLTIEGFPEIRAALDRSGETDCAFVVSQCSINKLSGGDSSQEVTVRRLSARSNPGQRAEAAGEIMDDWRSINEERAAPPDGKPIDFAVLDQMFQRLTDEYRTGSKTIFPIKESLYLRIKRRMRKINRRTLYGLRMIARGEGLTRAQTDRLARSDFAARSSLPEYALSQACKDVIAASSAADLFPSRERRDRWLGDPDLFICCNGRGFHDVIGGQTYCPCAAGRRRAELDRVSP